jgi:hypothetical protein
MNEIEAIGDLAQGGLTARALEPTAGERADPGSKTGAGGHTHETACLNCGTPLAGSHCHACGQRGHQHKTLGAFFHDLLHGVLHFEGKIWRTLPLLAWRPGQLTREYIDGRRASYVSPIALFLFSMFVMFAALQLSSVIEPEEPREITTTTEDSGRIVIDPDGGDGGGRFTFQRTGWDWADRSVAEAAENPSLMLYKLKANSYKFSWLLVPLSTPFVWLLFAWRRRFGPYDHAVFVTYSLCFVSLFYVSLWALDWLGVPGAPRFFAAILVPPLHIYRQLKGAYELRRFSALWRTAALLAFIPIIIVLFLQILVIIGLSG